MQMLSTTYDTKADALYIRLRGGATTRTECLDDWTMVDVDATGAAIGIEVIHPARVWPLAEFLQKYKITGPNRDLLEQMFPQAKQGRRAPFHSQDVDLDTDAEEIVLAL